MPSERLRVLGSMWGGGGGGKCLLLYAVTAVLIMDLDIMFDLYLLFNFNHYT